MPLIDAAALAAPLDADAPCGEDLRYDAAYLEVDRLAQGTQEQVMGDQVIAAEEPNWTDVGREAVALLARSRDLRLVLYATLAALKTEGLPGLRDGLALLHRLLEKQWPHVHPRLDPGDDNDPTERINIIESIAQSEGSFGDPLRFIGRLREAPLCESRQLGRFCHRDLLLATGELPWPAGGEGEPPTLAVIEAAFEDTDTEWLQANAEALAEAAEHAGAIDAFLVATLGAEQAAQLDPLKKALAEVGAAIQAQLARRGYSAPEIGPAAAEAPAAAGPAPRALSGDITCADDVLKAIDKVCKYYEAREPSSPVPLILRRAQRLVAKNFFECIQDLSPNAMQDIQHITGIDTSAQAQ